jgi:glucose/arabinose dehydrogenase
MEKFAQPRATVLAASIIVVNAIALNACSSPPALPESAGMGKNPTLPPAAPQTVPTVNIAPARGWADGQTPMVAPGFTVAAYAADLDHPRWLYALPNGDVLVAETNAPQRPDDRKGLRGWFMGKAMKRAGAATPSANRITLLRDADGDGRAEVRTAFLQNLNSPFGMALIGDRFYVANTDAVLQFPYREGQTRIDAPGVKVVDLPAGSINRHWTRNLIAGPDGQHLYVTVGSNSNVAENGMENEEQRAAILEIDIAQKTARVFASGLRNPNGLAWHPQSRALWTAVNERDEIGPDLVPDYITAVKDGGFYGWPYSYYGSHVDERVKPQRPDMVARAIPPDYALGSHTASLGLAFYDGAMFPQRYQAGAFIGQHGSWNRKPRSGYKVIFVPFENGQPSGMPENVLTGFVSAQDEALGRPVGIIVDRAGAVLVADDVGNRIWRITPAAADQSARAESASGF